MPPGKAASLLPLALLSLLVTPTAHALPPFRLAPAVALEAEDFRVESGWKIVRNGHGNYMVDAVGYSHVSGERMLGLDAADKTASACADVNLPEAGDYRLWVRYEYPPFCETRFRVVVTQEGRTLLDHVMGTKDSPRYAYGELFPRAQHDPASGPEGLADEVVTVRGLKGGKARIYLKGTAQPQKAGVAARRHVDLLYLTRDTADAWRRHYRARTREYPLLDAFRDSRGPRYEVRFTNRGDRPTDFHVAHVYNRVPWGVSEADAIRTVAPGATSGWVGLRAQDTAHFGLVRFASAGQPFDVEVRPVGGTTEKKLSGPGPLHVYLPPYPGKGEKAVTPEEEIAAVRRLLARTPAPGKKPTLPLCYGGWMPLGQENAYGRAYAGLYAALGLRALHPAHSGPAVLKNLEAAGIAPTKSWTATGYRNLPTEVNVEKAVRDARLHGVDRRLGWFDYGEEADFGAWLRLVVEEEVARAKRETDVKLKPEEALTRLWLQWLRANRPTAQLGDYWLSGWGPLNLARMRPDSSARAAAASPCLYVDSLLFYEDTVLRFAAEGAKAVHELVGEDVRCLVNPSCPPFYRPHTATFVKWFRRGAADAGRPGELFWQAAQAGPMVNGYVTEHVRAGLRDNPRGVVRAYTMPHSPGNTEASFLRTAFTHLAHGATRLDFFGIGMDETFTENHIDHRDHARYRALRDVTHCVGLVEDVLPEARPVPSPVALLVSESTERWDLAGIARDFHGHAATGPDSRKTRLHYHLDRLGLWTAFTFLGVSPDLILEEDVNARVLKDYKLLVIVGDCLPPAMAPALEAWVRDGGVLLATAGAGRYDSYREPSAALQKLFGLESRRTEERATFLRPRQELPFLTPLGTIRGRGCEMPQLALFERIGPAKGAEVMARFKEDNSPAVVARRLGKGHTVYVAALPGVAYLWSALQPPRVPDRGPTTHSVPTAFDPGARVLLQEVLKAAAVEPMVAADPPLIDRRLLRGLGTYILPVANYQDKVGQKVTLAIKVSGRIRKVTSAYHGVLPMEQEEGIVRVTIPALGYGDVLRLDVDKRIKQVARPKKHR